ncbi:MAG: HD domain-containing protein, partial [Bacilli bacterium]
KNPITAEEQIVHDANYIELLGAFGIAKAFTKGGAEGQTYEQTADIFEHQFLDVVEFKTPVGKQIASEKRTFTKEFLARLRAEL